MLLKGTVTHSDFPSPTTKLELRIPTSLEALGKDVSSFTSHKIHNGKIELWSRQYPVGDELTILSDDIQAVEEKLGEILQELKMSLEPKEYESLKEATMTSINLIRDGYRNAMGLQSDIRRRISRKRGERLE